MSLENNEQVKSDENQEGDRKVDNSRRSFAKKSAAMVPVVFTLANRSAWGREIDQCTQSGFTSLAAGSVTAIYIKKTFDPLPPVFPDNTEADYRTWAILNGLPGDQLPMLNWTVPQWEQFVSNCSL